VISPADQARSDVAFEARWLQSLAFPMAWQDHAVNWNL